MGDNSTLDWYRDHVNEFIGSTAEADLTATYRLFVDYVPAGGQIMDLGCGAGNAALYFTQRGYQVLAADGCPVRCMRFDELDYTDTFDGIWACASLLHVRKAELPGILRLIHRALKKDGIFYASFKYGDLERKANGRAFSDFTEEPLRTLLDEVGGYEIIRLWTTQDVRPGRGDERWTNLVCRAKKE